MEHMYIYIRDFGLTDHLYSLLRCPGAWNQKFWNRDQAEAQKASNKHKFQVSYEPCLKVLVKGLSRDRMGYLMK